MSQCVSLSIRHTPARPLHKSEELRKVAVTLKVRKEIEICVTQRY